MIFVNVLLSSTLAGHVVWGFVVHVGKIIALPVCVFVRCRSPLALVRLSSVTCGSSLYSTPFLVPCWPCGLLSCFNAMLALWLVSDSSLGKEFRLRGSVGRCGVYPYGHPTFDPHLSPSLPLVPCISSFRFVLGIRILSQTCLDL